MQLTAKKIVQVTLIAEGILLGCFLIWASHRGLVLQLYPNWWELLLGIVLAGPIFVVSYLFFGPHCERIKALRSCFYFKDQIVSPLAKELNLKQAALISIAAGLGEEVFFRGIIQEEFGLVAASVLFSFLHFGRAFFTYLLIGIIYTVIGFYFGIIVLQFNSLWVAIIAHSFYDFLALLYMRHLYHGPLKPKVVEPDVILRR